MLNWEQLKAILFVRWQLARNQWRRRESALSGVIVALTTVGAIIIGAGCFTGGLLGGMLALGEATPRTVTLVWLVLTGMFLMFWTIGLLAELQRSEVIDLQRLMHLPVALGQIFVINYLASHFVLSIVLALPAALGLSIGLAISRGPLMLLLIPFTLAMMLMVSAWTYCLRGWLTALMTNPRRRRSIIAALTLILVLIAQIPNLYFNVFNRGHSNRASALFSKTDAILAVAKFIPPLWLPLGAGELAHGDAGLPLLGAVGCLCIGALGLRRAYRSTLKFYHGEADSRAPAGRARSSVPRPSVVTGQRESTFMEKELPGVSGEASAVALAAWRSLLRAPELKMAWLMSIVVTAVFGAMFIFRTDASFTARSAPFLIPAIGGFTLLTLSTFFANQFGYDRDAFRAFVLCPADRRSILLGKNLAALPVISLSGLAWLLVIAVWLRPSPSVILSGFCQIAIMCAIACIIGNFLSIYLPFRVQAASLKPTKLSGDIRFFLFLAHFAMPFCMIPVALPPLIEMICRSTGVLPGIPINFLLSLVVASLVAGLYWLLLPFFGRRLQQRERRILETVTTEIE